MLQPQPPGMSAQTKELDGEPPTGTGPRSLARPHSIDICQAKAAGKHQEKHRFRTIDSSASICTMGSGSSEALDKVGQLPNFAPAGEVLSPTPSSSFTHRSRGVAASSAPSSYFTFAEPAQSLIMFDWDDTLFPTTEFCDRLGFSSRSIEGKIDPMATLTQHQKQQVVAWREALRTYLEEACTLSDRVCIITNSSRPWVTSCLECFAPDLLPIFSRAHRSPEIIYAFEKLPVGKRVKSQCMNLRPVRHREIDMSTISREEQEEENTQAKYRAMKEVATEFYSRYPGQTWKNIISLGDMRYEHDAVQEVTFRRTPGLIKREYVRTKAIILPTMPTLSEITLRLSFSRHMLKAYVHFNGDLDIDLTTVADPVKTIAEALGMSELAAVDFSRHAWGRRDTPPDSEEISKGLADVEILVHNAIYG
mmetsp:Transcript_20730/g.44225  ORF Transcript_20730/g.44225 Transcript_20730/m.44225 type:complete len:421 (+) Transcript_20730:28-1290(+)